MKKIALILITLAYSLSSFSQEGHSKFNGLSIDGNYQEFVNQLTLQDFSILSDGADSVIMAGEFDGVLSVITVICTPNTKTVWQVMVTIPTDKKLSIDELHKNYFSLKNTCTNIYGIPIYDSDMYYIPTMQEDERNSISVFNVQNGEIWIELTPKKELRIHFEDAENASLYEEEMEELNEE